MWSHRHGVAVMVPSHLVMLHLKSGYDNIHNAEILSSLEKGVPKAN